MIEPGSWAVEIVGKDSRGGHVAEDAMGSLAQVMEQIERVMPGTEWEHAPSEYDEMVALCPDLPAETFAHLPRAKKTTGTYAADGLRFRPYIIEDRSGRRRPRSCSAP